MLLNSAGFGLSGKKVMGSFEEPNETAVRRSASDVVAQANKPVTLSETLQQGPVHNPLGLVRQDLEKRVSKNFERMQGIRDQIYERMRERAMVNNTPPELLQMSHEEALKVGGTAMALRGMGVRDQFIQPAVQNYIQGRQGMLNQENARNMMVQEAQTEQQRELIAAKVANLQSQMEFLSDDNKQVYNDMEFLSKWAMDQENHNQALEIEGLKQQGRFTLEDMKAANRILIDQARMEGKTDEDIRAVHEKAAQWASSMANHPQYQNLSEETLLAIGYDIAWSEAGLNQGKVRGQNLENNLNEQINPFKVREAEADADKAEQEAKLAGLRVKYYDEEFQLKRDRLALDRQKAAQRTSPASQGADPAKARAAEIKDIEALKKLNSDERKLIDEELSRIRAQVQAAAKSFDFSKMNELGQLYDDAVNRKTELDTELFELIDRLKGLRTNKTASSPNDPVDIDFSQLGTTPTMFGPIGGA